MAPPIVKNAGDLLEAYEAIFCDVWGVLHNGRTAYAEAGAALAKFRAGGGTVVLVSNAPVPAAGAERVLEKTGVRRDCWDAIVSSGDIALAHIREQGFTRLTRVGPGGRDGLFFSALPGPHVELDEAEAIACTGLVDDLNEKVEDYRWLIDGGLARRLPFVCANPDLVVDVGTDRLLCAGSIAEVYEREGGMVFWAGKPHPSAYGTALKVAAGLRGAEPARAKILGIGDAVRTDLAAAKGLGIAAIFIASGIHNHETLTGDAVDPAKIARLFGPATPPAVAVMDQLRW
jgi:HAD superfamily hydrolase (TIGR01459 family)